MGFYDQPDNRQGQVWEPAPRGKPMDLRSLRAALTVMFFVIATISALMLVGYLLRSFLVTEVLDERGPDQQLETYEDRAGLLDAFLTLGVIAWVVMVLAIAPVFIVWQFRHAKNAQLLGASGGLGPEWAIGGWFVPVANLLLPALQLYGAGRYSHPRRQADTIVVAWWVGWLAGKAFYLAAALIGPDDALGFEYLRQLRDYDRLAAIAAGLDACAAIIALVMVRRFSHRQEVALRGRPAVPTAPAPHVAWPAPPRPAHPGSASDSPAGTPRRDVPAPPPVPPPGDRP